MGGLIAPVLSLPGSLPVSSPPYRGGGKTGKTGTHPKSPETGRTGRTGSHVFISCRDESSLRLTVGCIYPRVKETICTISSIFSVQIMSQPN